MKNIFKFMGVALVACSLMVACGKDEEEPTDTTPVTPPTPTAGVKVVWDGVEQNLGFTDAYASTQAENVYWFEGAKGLVNEEYQYPAFFVAFYDGGAGFYPAFFYYSVDRNGDTVRFNKLYPTEVYNEGGFEVQGELHGDYQLYGYNGEGLPVLTWDANTKKLSCELSITFYNHVAYASTGETILKNLDLTFTDYAFDAAK